MNRLDEEHCTFYLNFDKDIYGLVRFFFFFWDIVSAAGLRLDIYRRAAKVYVFSKKLFVRYLSGVQYHTHHTV